MEGGVLSIGPLGKFMVYIPVGPLVWRPLATCGPVAGPGQRCVLSVWMEH